jgi:hypothetical protein
MIDPLNCVRYILSEDIDSFNQKLITQLSERFPGIFLIHKESEINHNRVSTRLTLFHHQWGPTFLMELHPLNQAQTLILIPAPPDPDLEDVSSYENKILENLPDSSASIRLARVDGNDVRALALIRTALREQRHHCWMQIQSGLIRSLGLKIYDGDLQELNRDIPNENGDDYPVECSPSQDESLVLDLWAKGYTAKQIALRMGRTEKTILNKLTLMRKAYGEQLVPRRRMA